MRVRARACTGAPSRRAPINHHRAERSLGIEGGDHAAQNRRWGDHRYGESCPREAGAARRLSGPQGALPRWLDCCVRRSRWRPARSFQKGGHPCLLTDHHQSQARPSGGARRGDLLARYMGSIFALQRTDGVRCKAFGSFHGPHEAERLAPSLCVFPRTQIFMGGKEVNAQTLADPPVIFSARRETPCGRAGPARRTVGEGPATR